MSTLSVASQLTLTELAKRIDPQGDLIDIVNPLTEDNEVLQDAVWLEANDIWSHKYTQVISMPSGSWRKLNEGVANEAGITRELRANIGMLYTYSEVDKDLADSAPNPMAFRTQEAAMFLEGMSQSWADKFFYGDESSTPEEFTGIAQYLNDTDLENVEDIGGSGGDTTSLYVIQWGPNRCFMVYPRGSQTLGITRKDLGEVTLEDASNNNYPGYREYFSLKCGLVVKNTKCVGRVANIESSGSTNIFTDGKGDDALIRILNKMPQRGSGTIIYANDTLISQIEIDAKDKSNVWYPMTDPYGQRVMTFRGIPVHKCDAIKNTETEVTT